jgi:hypothetical protein
MYEDFTAQDPLTGEKLHCEYHSLIVAIATRHSDTVDIKFLVNGKAMWIALPHPAWVEFRRRSGGAITDRMAVDLAGYFLKRSIERGEGVDRNHWNDITVDDVMELARDLGWLRPSAGSGEGGEDRPATATTG